MKTTLKISFSFLLMVLWQVPTLAQSTPGQAQQQAGSKILVNGTAINVSQCVALKDLEGPFSLDVPGGYEEITIYLVRRSAPVGTITLSKGDDFNLYQWLLDKGQLKTDNNGTTGLVPAFDRIAFELKGAPKIQGISLTVCKE